MKTIRKFIKSLAGALRRMVGSPEIDPRPFSISELIAAREPYVPDEDARKRMVEHYRRVARRRDEGKLPWLSPDYGARILREADANG